MRNMVEQKQLAILNAAVEEDIQRGLNRDQSNLRCQPASYHLRTSGSHTPVTLPPNARRPIALFTSLPTGDGTAYLSGVPGSGVK